MQRNQQFRIFRSVRALLAACFLIPPLAGPSLRAEEIDAELELPKAWERSFNLRSWAGFNDNVLLAERARDASPYLAGGLDFLLWRMPLDEWEYTFLASGDYIRYLETREVHKEVVVTAQNRLRRRFGSGWEAGLGFDYLYFDQVFDHSELDREFASIQVQGHTFAVRPHLQQRFATRYRALLEFPITRQYFLELIDNHWEGGPRLSLRRDYGHRSELALTYEFTQRFHDTREKRDRLGQLVPGTRLEFFQHEISASLRHHWDALRRWRTVTRIGLQRNEDNGFGYYDYYRPRFTQTLRYQAHAWMLQAEARVSHFDYDFQPVSSIDLTVRRKTTLLLGLRGERNLTQRLKLFAEYQHERSISNLLIDRYEVNNIWGGVDWEF